MTSWFGLTKTDLGRKVLEIDCPEIFKESLIFSNRLRKQLHEELTKINNRKKKLSKEQFMRFENKREWFEFNEFEKEKAAENIQFISTTCRGRTPGTLDFPGGKTVFQKWEKGSK